MKFIVVLVLSLLFTIFVGTLTKNFIESNNDSLISPLVIDTNELTNGSSLAKQVFVNNYYQYKIKYPLDVNIKNTSNGNVNLYKNKSINISISQEILKENDTINTQIKNNIETKKNLIKDQYILKNNISPIAIGLSTALTYSTEENGESYSYYYIPQNNNKYLVVINSSPDNGSDDYLISEEIIYSLEMLP